MWIKLIGLDLFLCLIMLRHSNRRIVCTLFIIMGICFNVAHFCGFSICQLLLWTSHLFVLLLCGDMDYFTQLGIKKFVEQNLVSLFCIS